MLEESDCFSVSSPLSRLKERQSKLLSTQAEQNILPRNWLRQVPRLWNILQTCWFPWTFHLKIFKFLKNSIQFVSLCLCWTLGIPEGVDFSVAYLEVWVTSTRRCWRIGILPEDKKWHWSRGAASWGALKGGNIPVTSKICFSLLLPNLLLQMLLSFLEGLLFTISSLLSPCSSNDPSPKAVSKGTNYERVFLCVWCCLLSTRN